MIRMTPIVAIRHVRIFGDADLSPNELRLYRLLWNMPRSTTVALLRMSVVRPSPSAITTALTGLARKGWIVHPGLSGGPIAILRDPDVRTLEARP